MTALLRSASTALKAALAGGVPLWSADLFSFTLANGTTIYNWTSWDRDLVAGGVTYSSRAPWLKQSGWSVVNTLEVPTLTVKLSALNTAFSGGANIKAQIHNGLFDGAACLMSRAFMTTPGAPDALGALPLFGGKVGAIDLDGVTATIMVKGKVNDLDQYVPRNLFQIGCNHAFCDAGCTLNRGAYTSSYSVGSAPTATFIPWASAPANPTRYSFGTFILTSGAGAGQSRSITAATSAGLFLAYPLNILPAAGDVFSAFQGCDKTFNSGSGQSCTDRSNTQNYRGFEFVPPPNAAY